MREADRPVPGLSRRQVLRRFGATGAVGGSSLAELGMLRGGQPTARASASRPVLSDFNYVCRIGAGVASPAEQAHVGMGVTRTVDHPANGFTPEQLLTGFDLGTVSTDRSGRTVRESRFVAAVNKVEIAPGVPFETWTYNSRVPGPTIRATEGDRVRVELVNTSPHPHTIHFHGFHIAAVDGVPGMGEVYPGESFTYDFAAGPFGTKSLLVLSSAGSGVTITRVVERLEVAPSSVSAMVKRLAADGLVDHAPYGAISLTARERVLALQVVRRHRLVETFLHRVLGVEWSELHEEAEVLEHVISARLEQRIDEVLGHPTHDPHGDPIPPADGDHVERIESHVSLSSVAPETPVRVERVPDRDPAALRWLGGLGLRPGTSVVVKRVDPFGGPVWVADADGREFPVGSGLADAVLVSLTGGSTRLDREVEHG